MKGRRTMKSEGLEEILSFEDTAKELDKLLFVKTLKKQP